MVVRRLSTASCDRGNQRVCVLYGHERFQYCFRENGDCVLDLISTSRIRHPVGIVIDGYDYVKRHGVRVRLGSASVTPSERRHIRFFKVAGFQLSSFSEKTGALALPCLFIQ